MNAVFDRLGRFERSRTDQNDPDFANLQLSNPAPVAPAAVSSIPPPPYSQPLPTLLSMPLSMPSCRFRPNHICQFPCYRYRFSSRRSRRYSYRCLSRLSRRYSSCCSSRKSRPTRIVARVADGADISVKVCPVTTASVLVVYPVAVCPDAIFAVLVDGYCRRCQRRTLFV